MHLTLGGASSCMPLADVWGVQEGSILGPDALTRPLKREKAAVRNRPSFLALRNCRMRKKSTSVKVQAGRLEFVKLNTAQFEWRDAYHHILTLSWAQFAGVVLGVYVL